MKLATLLFRKKEYQYLELETTEDFEFYKILSNEHIQSFMKFLVNSKEKVSKWDHIRVSGLNASLFAASLTKTTILGGSPLIEMDTLNTLKNNGIIETMAKHGSVCIDLSTGSYRPPFDEGDNVTYEIINDIDIPLKQYNKFMMTL